MGPLWLVTCFCLWLRPRGRPSPKSGGGAWSATDLFTYFLSQWSHPRLKLHPVEVAQVVEPFRKAFVPAPGGHLLSNRSKTVTLNEGRSLHSTWLWGYEKYIIKKASTSNIGWSGFSLGELPFNIPCRPAEASGWWKVLHLLVTKSETTKLRTNSGLAVFEASCKSSRPPSKLHRYTSQLESTSGKAVMTNGKIKNIFSSSSTRSWRLAVFLCFSGRTSHFLQKFHIPIPSLSMQLGAILFLLNAPLEGNEFLFCTHLTSCWKTARTKDWQDWNLYITAALRQVDLPVSPIVQELCLWQNFLPVIRVFPNHFAHVLTYDFLHWKWQPNWMQFCPLCQAKKRMLGLSRV